MPGSQDYFGGITDARDRRSHSRQITTLNYIKLGESNGGILLNISEDGLAFTAVEPLVGEFVPRLRFQLEEKAEWIEASGRIVWLNDSKKGAGIQFLDISDADRGQIRRWIESKNLSEIQDAERIPRKIRKEAEVTPFPAPKSNTHTIEKQYEILEPHLRRMFPSESVSGVEVAHPAQSHQVEAFNKTQPANADYFPSENDARREVPVAPDPQVKIHSSSRAGRHAESLSESVAHVPAAETRFAQAVQVETLAETETHRKEKESALLERAPLIEHSESVPERRPDSTAHTNQFLPNTLASRSARVPTFGYQSTSAPNYEQPDDWTNWVDPAASTHRSKLGFVVMGVLLVVAAFAIGLAFGHGSLEGFIDNIREYVPDKYRQEPTANISAAESAPPAPKVEKTQTDTPAQAGSDNSVNQASEAPATSSPQTPSSQPVASRTDNNPATAASSQADTDSASETGKPAAGEGDSTPVLISVAGSGSGPFRLTAPETAVSATSSVAVSSQATILVPRAVGVDAAQEAKRLQLGTLVFRVDPQYPKKIGRGEVEIVKLLATVGENGQVTNVEHLSGSLPFATAAMSAIREWKYSPTLFDGRPVKTEEKITVAFRSH
jgi:hypothetical protein